MRAFVCVGMAIIATLTILSAVAEHCTTCCDGQPCNPELIAKENDHGPKD